MTLKWPSRVLSLLLLALALGGLGACSPYVNIPAQEGDLARNDANQTHVQKIVVSALEAVLENRPEQGAVYLILPEGSELATYEYIRSQLGNRFTWSAGHPTPPPPDGAVVFDVRQIRIRGWDGQVDIVRPMSSAAPSGDQQLVSVMLEYDPINRWRPVQVREWRTDVDRALRDAAATEVEN